MNIAARNVSQTVSLTIVLTTAFIGMALLVYAADSETLYLRTDAGDPCGAGDDESLNATQGSSDTDKLLGAGDSWTFIESARTIGAGDWHVYLDVTHDGSGGAPSQRDVTVLLRRMNSGCTQQEVIINQTLNVAKGATVELDFSASKGQITFADSDILLLEVTNADAEVTLHYNGAGSGYDSRHIHPDLYTDSCTCPTSGNWDIIGGDDCTLSDTCNLSGDFHISNGSLAITPTGELVINSGYKAIIENANAKLAIEDGGRLVIHD